MTDWHDGCKGEGAAWKGERRRGEGERGNETDRSEAYGWLIGTTDARGRREQHSRESAHGESNSHRCSIPTVSTGLPLNGTLKSKNAMIGLACPADSTTLT